MRSNGLGGGQPSGESGDVKAEAICAVGEGGSVEDAGDDEEEKEKVGGGRRRRVGGEMSAWKTGKGTISDR